MINQKTLYILRHAKAEAGSAAQEDHLRHLSARGVEDAARMGAYLVASDVHPERILCSTAVRTAETLMKIEEAYRHTLPVKYVEKLYLASANDMLALIAGADQAVTKLMVIGHNPGLHQLSLMLAKSGDPHLLEELAMKLPTATFLSIEFSGASWNGIKHGGGKLTHFVTPKLLGGGQE
jgi:phosphohistidine phosphatase